MLGSWPLSSAEPRELWLTGSENAGDFQEGKAYKILRV